MVDQPATTRHAGLVGTLHEREREVAAVEELLDGRGRMLLLEGRAGIGKTSLLEVACSRAAELGFEVLRARGSELESGFAFGVVRQLFERRLALATQGERAALLAGPAAAARPLLAGEPAAQPAGDSSFAVLHGLYWLVVNLAAGRPLLLAIDDAHWADEPSLRWLAYLARRLDGLVAGVLVALRPGDPAAMGAPLLAVCAEAAAVLRPALLSEQAVSAVVRTAVHAGGGGANGANGAGGEASDELCAAVYAACGGNPLYLTELLRAAERGGRPMDALEPAELLAGGLDAIARQVITRVRGLGPDALRLAQALAVLGDGGELRHAAAIAGVPMAAAARLAGGLTRAEVLAAEVPAAEVPAAEVPAAEPLAAGDRPRFVHPVIRDALEAVLDSGERDRAHRDAARLLHADMAPPGQVAAHLVRVRQAGDGWVLARLREAARAAMDGGAPQAAASLLDRALAEPPSPGQRAGVLREAARAQVTAGRERAFVLLEEALRVAAGPRVRAEIALEVAEAYAALFRWVDAVDVIERALAELGPADEELAARLEGELVVCGLHDARRAPQVAPVLARLSSAQLGSAQLGSAQLGSRRLAAASEPVAAAQGMAMLLAGRPASQIAAPLEQTLTCSGPEAANWDTRAALLWVLVAAERFGTVEASLGPTLEQVHRCGSARGLVAAYSTLGLLKLRLGALPEADAAARVALYVLQEGDFAPGLGFAATVLSDVAVEAGQLDEAQLMLDLLPRQGWPAGSGPCSSRRPADACGWRRAGPPRRWPTSGPAGRCSAPRCGACPSARRVTCTRAPAPRSRCCGWASARTRCGWPTPSWPTCGCSARRARSGSRCGWPGWPAAARRAWPCCASRRPCLTTPPRCSSAPARWPNSARPCAGTVSAPRPGTRWPGRSSSRPAAAPGRWPPGPATSSGRPAPARGVRGGPGWTR